MELKDVMTLEETVDWMCSYNTADRFKAEFVQTRIRWEKLRAYLPTLDRDSEKYDLLHNQFCCMSAYLDAMRWRMEHDPFLNQACREIDAILRKGAKSE